MTTFKPENDLTELTHHIKSLEVSELLLMNDNRWPWLILVPRVESGLEWHELFTDQRQDIDLEISNAAAVLKAVTQCDRINIASLGNISSQLQIHIVARTEGDVSWPSQNSGKDGEFEYRDDSAGKLATQILDLL